jgi:uncharacterized protein (TIGR00266 family)
MTEGQWFVGMGGQQQGPIPLAQVEQMIRAGTVNHTAYVFGPGLAQWTPIMQVPQLAAMLGAPMVPPGAPPAGPAPGGVARVPDEIDYEIFGSEMQYVEITLDPGEACVSEAGAMMYMEPGIEMETVFGDGSKPQQQGGFMDKVLSAGKRVITGESLFMTHFTNKATERRKAAFAAPYPGKIIPMDLRQHGGVMICQKDSFLVAAKGIEVGIAFQKKIGVGLFGGEGFILQKLSGQGLGFVHAGGTILERQLEAGYVLRIDTGCIVAFEQQVAYDIQFVGSVKTALFGGEGLFYATLTGPGRVWLQSLPFSRIANRVFAAWGGRGPDQGSVLGGLGLGD